MAAELDSFNAMSVDGENDKSDNLVKSAGKKVEGLFQRFLLRLDESVCVKLVMGVWGPRIELFVRFVLVATFFDDSFHTLIQFSDHAHQIVEQGCLRFLFFFKVATFIAYIALGMGVLIQLAGSSCILASVHPNAATASLIAWTIAQPVLYAQLTNHEFVAESLSLVGGLLTLRAHLLFSKQSESESERRIQDLTQLLSRLLLPTTYVYYAGHFLYSARALYVSDSALEYISSLSIFFFKIAVLVALVIGCALVATGLRSRAVALSLALANVTFVFYRHPFFRFLTFEEGQLKYVESKLYGSIPNVALPESVHDMDFTPKEIYDLHRYYFFLGLSTSGALLLLARFGPGDIAVRKNEQVIPLVTRAQV